MRPQQNFNHNKRGRGRRNNNGGGGSGGGGGGGGNNNKPQNILHRNFESTGPDVKVRGNAQHVYEKYLQLARDANSGGDRVMAESYLQHAEHYFRIIAAAQASMPQHQQPQQGGNQQNGNGNNQHQNNRYNGSDERFGSPSDDRQDGDEPQQGAEVISTQPQAQPQQQAPAEDEQPVV